VEGALAHGGVSVPALSGIELGHVTPWGRAVTVRLRTAGGRVVELNANRFRLLVGADVVRSTMFTIAARATTIDLTGRGSGHGVGLDQWGARAMAARGFTYDHILKYYYTDTAIQQPF